MGTILSEIFDDGQTPSAVPPCGDSDRLAALINRLDNPTQQQRSELSFDLTAYQSDFITAPDRGYDEVLYSGAVGGGKSLALCLAILRYVSIPNTPVLLTRWNLSDLKRSTLRTLLLPEVQLDGTTRPPLLNEQSIASFNRTECVITLHNGSSIICVGASDPSKIRSITAAACFIDEATEFEDESYYAVTQRARVPCILRNTTFSATNPATRNHFLYKLFYDNKLPTRRCITVTSYANPHLPVSYIRSLERLPDNERRRQLLGEWTMPESAVFTGFTSKNVTPCTHLLGDKTRIVDFVLSQDYGGGSGGSGMTLLARDGAGNIYCLLEFFRQGPSHSQVLDWMEPYRQLVYSRVVYDSANAALKLDMENRGWACIPCLKDVEGSVAMVNSRFHDQKLFIDPSCTNLISQLEEAGRDPETGMIRKVKDWDVIDAFRYGVAAMVRGDGAAPSKPAFTGLVIRRKT